LRKSGKETPFIYQQIHKLIEIGLLCQEKDPYKRPSISDVIRDINELESIDRQISNANESTAEQVSYCAPHDFNSSNTSLLPLLFFTYYCFVSRRLHRIKAYVTSSSENSYLRVDAHEKQTKKVGPTL
jgi:predicted P-loop ATPase/GTPase